MKSLPPTAEGNLAMLESLLCNSCGAPLEVPGSANFIKCNHCNTTLKIQRSSGATTTEAIEKLTETTQGLSQQLERLARQNELEKLDRNWESHRQSFVVPGQHGDHPVPAPQTAWIGGAAVVFFGLLWTVMTISITRSAPNVGPFAVARFVFPLFGIGFTVFGLFIAVKVQQIAKQNRKKYFEAERAYRHRRESVTNGDESP